MEGNHILKLITLTATFAVACFLTQFLIVLALFVSGLAMVIPYGYIYWITLIGPPVDYMEVGRFSFIVRALAFNTLICTTLFVLIYWSLNRRKKL